jgi:ABC-type phosphate/phosphonate transport system substrate-binding protein
MNRRRLLVWASAGLCLAPALARAAPRFRFGLTPVFLDNDAAVIAHLRGALSRAMGAELELVQRRTYEEVTGLILEGGVDAAWICGYPYVQHDDVLSLIAVPIWRGEPLYRSYLITAPGDPAKGLADLEGGAHAFSDPNSNSGYLVTASDLVRIGRRAEEYFSRTIFTYGHRNVVRAVASGLTRSGSVDGYVWEALTVVEPELTSQTKVIARSELLGFPPIVARTDRRGEEAIAAFRTALLGMSGSGEGQVALALLQLDGMAEESSAIFDGIRVRMHDLEAGR